MANQLSATPANRNSSMYQLLARWAGSSRRASAEATGCGALAIVSERTRPGCSAAVAHASPPPQS